MKTIQTPDFCVRTGEAEALTHTIDCPCWVCDLFRQSHPMDTLALLESLESAQTIVRQARLSVASSSSALWQQLNRVYEYLDAQMKAHLASLTSEA
jgi:hypothetical protein